MEISLIVNNLNNAKLDTLNIIFFFKKNVYPKQESVQHSHLEKELSGFERECVTGAQCLMQWISQPQTENEGTKMPCICHGWNASV